MPLPVQYHGPAYHVPGAAIPADHLPGVAIPAAASPASTVFIQRLMHHLAAVLLASLPQIVPAPNGVNFCAAAADDDDDDDDIVACVFGVL